MLGVLDQSATLVTMELSVEQVARIHAALATIKRTFDEALGASDTSTLAQWAHDHLHPAPGSRVPIADAVDQASRDLGIAVTSRQLGRVVIAGRKKSNSRVYYTDTALS